MAATLDMAAYCFDHLLFKLNGRRAPKRAIDASQTCGGLFVTWECGPEWTELRGCIGSLSKTNIKSGLERYTICSAFEDRRFNPIKLNEVHGLRCSVSLLTSFEEAEHVYDWDIRIHGIIINFSAKSRSFSATYLPDVALDQGWTLKETIDSLIKKSGYRGAINDSLRNSIRVTRYQSSKVKLSYEEYLKL
eukprot:g3838.t1